MKSTKMLVGQRKNREIGTIVNDSSACLDDTGLEYLEALRLQCGRSRRLAGELRFLYRIAGYPVAVVCPDTQASRNLLAALSHLPSHKEKPVVTFEVWDSSTAREEFLRPPRQRTSHKWIHLGLTDNRVSSTYDPFLRIFSSYDSDSCTGYFYTDDLASLPYWEFGFPLRFLIHWWTRSLPIQLVHSAAITPSNSGKALLLTGVGGSGKSTTALMATQNGFGYLGDDYVIVEASNPPVVHSLYCSAKITHDTLARNPWLEDFIVRHAAPDEKYVVIMGQGVMMRSPVYAEIGWVLLPHVSPLGKTSSENLNSAAALQAVAPTTVTHLPLGTTQIIEKINTVFSDVRVKQLELGEKTECILEALESMCNE